MFRGKELLAASSLRVSASEMPLKSRSLLSLALLSLLLWGCTPKPGKPLKVILGGETTQSISGEVFFGDDSINWNLNGTAQSGAEEFDCATPGVQILEHGWTDAVQCPGMPGETCLFTVTVLPPWGESWSGVHYVLFPGGDSQFRLLANGLVRSQGRLYAADAASVANGRISKQDIAGIRSLDLTVGTEDDARTALEACRSAEYIICGKARLGALSAAQGLDLKYVMLASSADSSPPPGDRTSLQMGSGIEQMTWGEFAGSVAALSPTCVSVMCQRGSDVRSLAAWLKEHAVVSLEADARSCSSEELALLLSAFRGDNLILRVPLTFDDFRPPAGFKMSDVEAFQRLCESRIAAARTGPPLRSVITQDAFVAETFSGSNTIILGTSFLETVPSTVRFLSVVSLPDNISELKDLRALSVGNMSSSQWRRLPCGVECLSVGYLSSDTPDATVDAPNLRVLALGSAVKHADALVLNAPKLERAYLQCLHESNTSQESYALIDSIASSKKVEISVFLSPDVRTIDDAKHLLPAKRAVTWGCSVWKSDPAGMRALGFEGAEMRWSEALYPGFLDFTPWYPRHPPEISDWILFQKMMLQFDRVTGERQVWETEEE
ncbi:MAG: hypothetical protein WC712_01730 [Candidatus Brocadiia bacterium]